MPDQYWGYHLILDVGGCDVTAITDHDTIYNFVKELVPAIDMVAYGEPQIVNFGSGDKAGYTLVQLIETSNICAHFVPSLQQAYIDVFSCKPFSQQVVVYLVEKYFKNTKSTIGYLERQAG